MILVLRVEWITAFETKCSNWFVEGTGNLLRLYLTVLLYSYCAEFFVLKSKHDFSFIYSATILCRSC